MAQYRRTNFLINKGFQLRFAAFISTWLFALSFIYPIIVYNVFDHLIAYAAKDPSAPPVDRLYQTRDDVFFLLIGLQVTFLAVTFLIGIFMSHRIAGPLFKLKRFFAQAKAGNLQDVLYFREKDHFKDVAEDYNQMMQGIRGRISASNEQLSASIHQIERVMEKCSPEARGQLDSALAGLRNVREKLPK